MVIFRCKDEAHPFSECTRSPSGQRNWSSIVTELGNSREDFSYKNYYQTTTLFQT